jgi:putative ABC transport system permease protein
VRMALGAEAGRVRAMIVTRDSRVVALGIVIGAVAAAALTRALAGLLFDVPAIDVPTFVAMSGVLLLVGLLASYMPARRASNVDPIRSLRAE